MKFEINFTRSLKITSTFGLNEGVSYSHQNTYRINVWSAKFTILMGDTLLFPEGLKTFFHLITFPTNQPMFIIWTGSQGFLDNLLLSFYTDTPSLRRRKGTI